MKKPYESLNAMNKMLLDAYLNNGRDTIFLQNYLKNLVQFEKF